RIIGSVAGDRLPSCGLKKMRLHVRAIIRDRELGFIGSQSLRRLELDRRREVGVIFRDGSAIKDLVRVFEEDWADSASKKIEKQVAKPAAAPKKAFKKVARAVAKEIPLKPVAKKAVKAIAKQADVDEKKIHEVVKEIVKDVVEEAAKKAAAEAAKTVA